VVEDPRAALDDLYRQQLDAMTVARRALADVVAARERLEAQAWDVQERMQALRAKDSISAEAAVLQSQADDLGERIEARRATEARLLEAARRMQSEVAAFRVEKEIVVATYRVARAEAELSALDSGSDQ
jgi:phage shock protein A